jgi:hypothetical protein
MPWIVDGFDLGPTDVAARREMSRLLGWQATHEDLFQAEPWAGVGALISLGSRNVLHRPLIPPHISALREVGTPVIGLRDDAVSLESLKPFRVVTVETSACLSVATADVLAKWVRSGGTLIAARDTETYDELGRRRDVSSLWHALELSTAPSDAVAVGKGKVIAPAPEAFAKTVVGLTDSVSFHLAAVSGIEVVPYRTDQSLLIHLVGHGRATGSLTLRLPSDFAPAGNSAQWFIPGSEDAAALPVLLVQGTATFAIKDVPVYSVLRLPLRPWPKR